MLKLNIKNNSELKIGYVIDDYSQCKSGTGVITSIDDEYIHLKGVYHDRSSHNINIVNASKKNNYRIRRKSFDYLVSCSGLGVFANMADYINHSRDFMKSLNLTDLREREYQELLEIESSIFTKRVDI